MSIDVYKNTKIYIAAPAASATGGPELLHQLAYYLRENLNMDSFMYYVPTNHANPVHEAYKEYRNPFVRNIDDEEQNVLIVPELYTIAATLVNFKNIRKVLWWLSADNFYISMYTQKHWSSLSIRTANKFARVLRINPFYDLSEVALRAYKNRNLRRSPILTNVYLHLVQSEYARHHLMQQGIENIAYLSDYLNKKFLERHTDISKKEDIVAYNGSISKVM